MCWLQSSQANRLDSPPLSLHPILLIAPVEEEENEEEEKEGHLRPFRELTGKLWHPWVKTTHGFKSAVAIQSGSLDGERDGHISPPGQSKCDEWLHHRPLVPQFVPGGQLWDNNYPVLCPLSFFLNQKSSTHLFTHTRILHSLFLGYKRAWQEAC